jgi:C-terminal processing protease CtpA/Prc
MAPANIETRPMYIEKFNTLMQQRKAPILKTIPYIDHNGQPVYIDGRKASYADIDFSEMGNTHYFSGTGTLTGIEKIAFIVSGATASASELLINSMKAYVQIRLVGSTTYGKPVGFFGIGIDRYTLYLSQFSIRNARNEGDYYEGFQPDIQAWDDVTRDFGDENENCLAAAVADIKKATPAPNTIRSNKKVQATSDLTFPTMIEKRLKLLH